MLFLLGPGSTGISGGGEAVALEVMIGFWVEFGSSSCRGVIFRGRKGAASDLAVSFWTTFGSSSGRAATFGIVEA